MISNDGGCGDAAEVADVDDVTPTAEEPPLALKLPPAIVLPLNLTEAAPLGNCCCCCRAASLQRLMALFFLLSFVFSQWQTFMNAFIIDFVYPPLSIRHNNGHQASCIQRVRKLNEKQAFGFRKD
uniref:Uncharacterized protein n=1 Tax=Glossina pallidipes TaxID=7398 RepID=A0A1B0AK41_GLOPL